MMKKRNEEGFALAYVVVVIFILCSIAIALMSSTLRTLQAQENMVQRMKDKYEAMGEIERLVAELEAKLVELNPAGTGITGDGKADKAKYDFSLILKDLGLIANARKDQDNYVDISPEGEPYLIYSRPLEINYKTNSASVRAVVDLVLEIDVDAEDITNYIPDGNGDFIPDSNGPQFKYTYTIVITNFDFNHYEITAGGVT